MSVMEKPPLSVRESPTAVRRLRRVGATISDELGVGAIHLPLLFVNSLITLFPFLTAKRLRTALYRMAGFRIGPRTVIYSKVEFWGRSDMHRNFQMGAECRISRGCSIDLNGPVTIGDRVVFGFGVTVVTASHRMDDPHCRAGKHDIRPVVIEDGAWIAANAIILPGVTIGARSVVGAGSIVTRNVPPDTLVAGNPAKFVRDLPTSNSEE